MSEAHPLLEVRAIVKEFPGVRALGGVDLSLRAGEVHALVGENGAGKSTLIKILAGVYSKDSGDILFEGRSIKGLKPNQTAQLGIGRTFQIVRPFPDLTTLDNVTLAALCKAGTRREARRRAEEILEITRLSPFANIESRNLTLARRKRLEIARAVALEPRIILLDEVMAGLTPAEVDETVALIKDLTAMGISAVAGVEHVMQAVRKISDWIVVLNFGQWLAEGPPNEVMRNREVIRAYLGSRYAEAEGLRW